MGSLAVSLLGLLALGAYESTPAGQQQRGHTWPHGSPLDLEADTATVLMFVHPKCPCTVASAEQLLRVLQSHSARGTLVCSVPAGAASDWARGPLLQLAATHSKHLKVVFDIDGELAKQFHVTTSGTCLIYTPDRQLRFAGGLTLSRGHRGANAGMEIIARIVGDPKSGSEQITFPVFGCSLVRRADPESN